MYRYIKVKNQFIDFHKWEDAPKEVEFLRNKHRHIFKVETIIEVFHDDRELEFFIIQGKIDEIVEELVKPMSTQKSCELMAETILDALEVIVGAHRRISVEVSEDGENASIVNNLKQFEEI